MTSTAVRESSSGGSGEVKSDCGGGAWSLDASVSCVSFVDVDWDDSTGVGVPSIVLLDVKRNDARGLCPASSMGRTCCSYFSTDCVSLKRSFVGGLSSSSVTLSICN
jgi:hypothetical protein